MGSQRVRHDLVTEQLLQSGTSNVSWLWRLVWDCIGDNSRLFQSFAGKIRMPMLSFLLTLLTHFSLDQLCVTPETAAHQAPPSHRQRSLVGYSPWGCKEYDMTEQLKQHSIHMNELQMAYSFRMHFLCKRTFSYITHLGFLVLQNLM